MWETAAEGWGRQRDAFALDTAPVSARMIDVLDLQPGQALLELAAGAGETGLLAAELLRPGGRLIATDGADKMVELIAQRARDLGLADLVEARQMEAEWIDLSAATVDAVLCRWGYMLLADPAAALRETRRVLKPGGRVVLAAWAPADENPWATVVTQAMADLGMGEDFGDAPGPFTWGDPELIVEHLREAGFVDAQVETVAFTFRHPDPDEWWDSRIDLSPSLGAALVAMDPARRDDLMEAAQARIGVYAQDDGSLLVPAATHVATADA